MRHSTTSSYYRGFPFCYSCKCFQLQLRLRKNTRSMVWQNRMKMWMVLRKSQFPGPSKL